ncbi:MAG: nitric oxide reductase NorD protein [Verrucomicrobiales bacterium]|jgi:nitric oxide reductase NorD protein
MFEWEESTFLGLKSLYQRLLTKPKERRAAEVRAKLKDRRQQLFILAQMIAGRNVTVFETDDAVLCDAERVFLPPQISEAPSCAANAAVYELKTILAGLAIRRQWRGDVRENLSQLNGDLPGLPERIAAAEAHFEEPAELWKIIGEIRNTKLIVPESTPVVAGDENTPLDGFDEAEITEIDGRGQLDVEVEEDRGDDGDGADLPMHTFEKAETVEEYTGHSRKTDDEDELEDHEEALANLDMNRLLRSRDRPASIYRADVLMDSPLFEASDDSPRRGVPYPEWDYKNRRYKPDWCYVQEESPGDGDPDWIARVEGEHRALIFDLKKKFAAMATEWLCTKRQPSGDEFDIEALVDNQVQWRTGQCPDENVYLHRNRELHDVSAMILLDRSFSTDGYIDGERVLDIIRETIFCAGEVLADFVEDFGVAAFSSNTRHQCSFQWVKNFDDPWHRARETLGDLRADGYTRIGPALRHAQEILTKRQACRRVVILVTDGKPCDYDRYEGTYGIRDVKMALETGHRHGISAHAFAVETRAKEYFPAMFTPDHYSIVSSPKALAAGLCDLFATLRAK